MADTLYRALVVDDDTAVRKATIRALRTKNAFPATRQQVDTTANKCLNPTATTWW